jgi:lysosomal acid lipase/cholesteryl ester hydrolase
MQSRQLFLALFFISSVENFKITDKNLTLKLIAQNGYTPEAHPVETLDGYYLTVHRIVPKFGNSKKNPPCFLMHGIVSQSSEFVMTGSDSLALTLAESGYDVWLGNSRGTPHSSGHKTLSPESSQYWDFSWHEIGFYDLPAMFDRMLQVTNSTSGFYIGHSQGSTVLLVLLATRPEYNSKIIQAHLSAPPVFMDNFRHLLFHQLGLQMIEKYSHNMRIDLAPFTEPVYGIYNKDDPVQALFFIIVLYMIAGGNIYHVEINPGYFPLKVFETFPTSVSSRQFLHYLQLVDSNKFREYDYGRAGNLVHYNRIEAPEYDLKRVTVPVFIYCAQQDIVVSEKVSPMRIW